MVSHVIPQLMIRKQNHKGTKTHGSPRDSTINHKGTKFHNNQKKTQSHGAHDFHINM
jgi:hypothetical protein